MRSLRHLAAAACLALALPALAAGEADFDIPAQPAGPVLEAFAAQSGLQVVFAAEAVAGLRSPGVSGRLAPREALARLLAGTGLEATFIGERTVAVKRPPPPAPGAAAAPQRADLEEVAVTGDRPYAARSASTATRTEAPLAETPVTVQVVDEALIRDRALTSPNQLADVVAGVQPVVGYGSTRSQYFLIRGFSNLGVSYRNGYRVAEVYTPRDLANVERVEFVKGPASVLYGAGQPGGAVNTITKQPLDRDLLRLDASGDTFSSGRLALDVNRTLGPVAVRLNAAGDMGDTWIDLESSRNGLLAPAVAWQVTPDVSLAYEGELQRTVRKGWSNGLLAVPGLTDLPVGTTLSEPWTRLFNTNYSNRLELRVRLSGDWAFRQGLYDARSRRSHRSSSPSFSADPVADGNSVGAMQRVYYTQDKDDPTNTASQTELTGTLRLAGTTHQLLGGFEASRARFEFVGAFDAFDTVDLGAPRPVVAEPVPTGVSGSRREARAFALYAQDQVAWGDLRLLGALRQEWVRSTSTSLPDNTPADPLSEAATTGRLGALYLLTPATAAYYAFSQSFTPNTSARTSSGAFLDAERGTQHEVGLKQTLWDGLDATAAVFQITKTNVAVPDPADQQFSIANGEQRSRGVEVSLAGRVTRSLKLVANFAWQEAKVTRDPDQQGQKLFGVPAISGNLWGTLALPAGFEAGLGLVHQGRREAAQPNLDYFKLPAFTRVDALLAWHGGRYRVALNVDNVADARIVNSLEGFAVLFDAPRRFALSAGVEY